MIVLIIILFFVSIYGVKFTSIGYNNDYISPLRTNAIKGIFAVVILFSHMRGYIILDGSLYDRGYEIILNWIGQLMVAIFFFYSGFGIIESLKVKDNYGQTFFRRRILKTLVHFDVAVFLFWVLSLILGQYYSTDEYLFSWVGWTSIGNSNWFIFDILILYSITWVAIKLKHQNHLQIAVIVMLLTALLWGILRICRTGSPWWVDTLLTYPAGMFFSVFRNRIENFMSNNKYYWLSFFAIALVFFLLKLKYKVGSDIYGVCSCLFSALIVLSSAKLKVDNVVLQWLGRNSFAIYVIQRWPMILLSYFGINETKWLFVVLAIPAALLVAWLFNKVLATIDKFLFS